MEVIEKRKNVILDATILSTLMSCERLTDFRFHHNFMPIEGKAPSLEKGSCIHKIMEVYYRAIINGTPKLTAIENGLNAGKLYISGCACSGWESEEISPPCGHKPDEYAGFRSVGPDDARIVLNTAEQYFEFYKHDFWIPLEAEKVKRELIYQDDEIRVLWKAKLDLTVDTNQEILPVDHKTMQQRRDTLGLNNQFIGQCFLMKSRKMVVNKIGFQTSLKADEKFTRVMMSYSLDRIKEWSEELVPYYARYYIALMENDYWPPRYSHCENKYGICPFKEVCEADRGMREEVLRNNFKVGPVWDIED